MLSTHSIVNFASYSRPLADGAGVSGAAVLDADLDGRLDLLLSTYSLTDQVAPGKTLIGFNTQAGSLQFSDMGGNQRVHWGSISSGDLGYGSSHPEVILDAGRVVSFGSGNTWSQVARYDVPNTYSNVGITDFDNDGRSDLVAVAGVANAVSISRQLPGGTFSSLVTTSYSTSSSAGFVAPFDDDSLADLLVMRVESFPLPDQPFNPLTVELWRGTSTGHFVFDTTLATGLSGRLASVTDVNGDGRKDLLFQTGNGSVLSVYLQNSSRGLTKVQDITVSTTLKDNSYFQTVAPLDYTGDGRADLAIWTWEGIKLYTAGIDERFSFAGSRTDARPTYFMVTGDFDGNGREELVVPAYNQGRVFVDIYDVVPVAAPPGIPTGVTGTAGNGQVTLTWTAPASNGGAAITDYVIQYSSNAGSTWTTFADAVSASTSTTVTGLTNGTGYTFRVAAKSSAGQGGYSTASSTVTPAAPVSAPGAPTHVTGVPGGGQVSLSWTTPASNGGAAITDYVIQYSSNAGSTWTTFTDAVSTATSTTVTGLANGTGYTFRVAAKNSAGQGNYSTASSTVTPASSPSAPLNVVGTPGNAQVSLRWSPPTSNGGAQITDYVIRYLPNTASTWITFTDAVSTATATTVTGLTNGADYTFRIAARNSVGQGTYSTASATVRPVAPVVPPGAPTGVEATAGNTQVSLSWTAPSFNGNAPITDYVIQYSSNGGALWTTFDDGVSAASSAVVSGLTNFMSYIFRVAARNNLYYGPYATTLTGVTPAGDLTVPFAPHRLVGVSADAQVRLDWNPPVSDGGSRITDYQVEYSSDNGASWKTYRDNVAADPVAVVAGLENGVTYLFRVAAINAQGVGPYTEISLPLTPTRPANNRPVLAPVEALRLNPTPKGGGLPIGRVGTPVSSLVYSDRHLPNFSDADGDMPGVAITGANKEAGTVWFTINDGETWRMLGDVADTSAALLYADAATRLYLQPKPGFEGGLHDVVSLRGWDRTGGFQNGATGVNLRLSTPHLGEHYGGALGVTLSRDERYAYSVDNLGTSFDSRLRFDLINVTDPRNPTRVGSIETSGRAAHSPVAISADGRYAFVADQVTGLRIFDVSNATSPRHVAVFNAVKGVLTVVLSADGRYAYIKTGNNEVQIVDISRPTVPSRVGSLGIANSGSSEGNALALTKDGQHLYVVGWSMNLLVIDVSNPSQPTKVGESAVASARGGLGIAISPSGSTALVTTQSGHGVKVFDIRNPRNPVVVGSFSTPSNQSLAVQILPNSQHAVVTDYFSGLLLVDIRNPADPVLVGQFNTAGYAFDVAVSSDGRRAFVADLDRLTVVDLSSLAAPADAAYSPATSSALGVAISPSNRHAYLTDWNAGLHIVDISSPTMPRRIASIDTLGNPVGVALSADGRHAFVAENKAAAYQPVGLDIIDVSEPSVPRIVGRLALPGNANQVTLSSSGRYAFIATSQGLVVVDVSDRGNPFIIGQGVQGNVQQVTLSGDGRFAFAASWDSGLQIFDVQNPSRPVVVGGLSTSGGRAFSVAVSRDGLFAFVGDLLSGLHVVDTRSPTNPVQVREVYYGSSILGVTLSGDGRYAFLSAGQAGLQVLDISNPVRPIRLGGFDTDGAFETALSIYEEYAFVADSMRDLHGLRVIPLKLGRSGFTLDDVGVSTVVVDTYYVPTDILLSATAIAENTAPGGLIGRLVAEDLDIEDGHSFELVMSGDPDSTGLFEIVGDELRSLTAFDFEAGASYSVRIRATDIGGRGFEKDFVISITDVVEDQVFEADCGSTVSIGEPQSGSHAVILRGQGRFVMELANTHSGDTVIEAGELVIRNAGALGTGVLRVLPSARVTFEVGPQHVAVSRLELAAGGTLDVASGNLIQTPGGYDLAAVRAWITSGRSGGTWSGPGIMSSDIQPGTSHEIGYQLLPDGSLKIGYSAVGDANMDGSVDLLDLLQISASGKYDSAVADAVWWEGDFNYDGVVDLADLINVLASGLYGTGSYLPVAATSQIVPEQSEASSSDALSGFIAAPTGETLLGESESAAATSGVELPDLMTVPPSASSLASRSVGRLAWAAIANQGGLEAPKDAKSARWRMLARQSAADVKGGRPMY